MRIDQLVETEPYFHLALSIANLTKGLADKPRFIFYYDEPIIDRNRKLTNGGHLFTFIFDEKSERYIPLPLSYVREGFFQGVMDPTGRILAHYVRKAPDCMVISSDVKATKKKLGIEQL